MKENDQHYVAKKSKDELSLIPSKRKIKIKKEDLGESDFEYSSIIEQKTTITQYTDKEEGNITKIKENYHKNHKVLGKTNLDIAIHDLEDIAMKNNAKYFFAENNPRSLYCNNHWDFIAKGKLVFLKTQK